MFTIYLFSFLQICNAQIPFVSKSFSSNGIKFEKAVDVCELPSGKFIFVGEKTDSDSTCFIFETDKDGIVLRSKYLFQKSDTSDYIPVNCFFSNSDKISLVGYNYKWNKPKSITEVFFAEMDTNLNVTHSKFNKFTNSDTALLGLGGFVNIGTNIFGSLSFKRSPDFFYPYTKLVRLDKIGNITHSQILDSTFYGGKYIDHYGTSPLSVSFDKNNLYFSGGFDGYLVKIDTNFKLIDSVKYNPTFFTQYTRDTGLTFINPLNIEIGKDNLMIGSQFQYSFTSDRVWGALKFNMHTRKIDRFGTFPKYTEPFDNGFETNANTNAVYGNNTVFTLGYTKGTLFRNYIVVCAFDTNAKPKWIKRVGDSLRQFIPQNIRICKDGSVMICAYSDSAASPSDFASRDESIYVIRLNPNTGEALSIRNISEQLRSGISLYPNPAKEMINIKGASIGSQILFYDMSGKLVLNEKITANNMALDIEYLSAANYSYQVINPDGQKLSSGIWVKQ